MNNYLLTFIEEYFVDISMDSGTVVVLVAVNVSMVVSSLFISVDSVCLCVSCNRSIVSF